MWKTWTDPEQVKRWWGPDGFSCPFARIDFRVDGKCFVWFGAAANHCAIYRVLGDHKDEYGPLRLANHQPSRLDREVVTMLPRMKKGQSFCSTD